jgi:acylphosphatase
MPDDIAWHLRITGVVQGVGFRYWTQREAARRGLRGWVRNRHDGSVEALIIGSVRVVEDMVEACRHGPRSAEVEAVEVTPAVDDGSAGFEHRMTA